MAALSLLAKSRSRFFKTRSKEELAGRDGLYWDRAAGKLRRVELGENGLRVPLWPGFAWQLVPLGGNRFAVPDESTELAFLGTGTDTTGLTEAIDGRVVRTYQKVPAADLSGGQLDDFIGAYRCDEMDVTWSVQKRGEELMVRRLRFADDTLAQTFADGFVLGGWDPVVFQRDERRQITGFVLSTFRLRNVWFRRVSDG